MYCKNCAKEIDDKATVCPHCGVAQTPQEVDNGGFGWGFLGCCVPIVGLILFLVWKGTKPKTAKAAGLGALISVILSVVLFALMFGLGIMSEMAGY